MSARQFVSTGWFRYIAFHAERQHFARNSVWAFNLAPAFPRGALTLCPLLGMGISPRRCTGIGLLFLSADVFSSFSYCILVCESVFRVYASFCLHPPCV